MISKMTQKQFVDHVKKIEPDINEKISCEFGTRLTNLRILKGFTEKQMTKQFNINEITYKNWESGKESPNIFQLVSLAWLFDIDMNTLFDFIDFRI